MVRALHLVHRYYAQWCRNVGVDQMMLSGLYLLLELELGLDDGDGGDDDGHESAAVCLDQIGPNYSILY